MVTLIEAAIQNWK